MGAGPESELGRCARAVRQEISDPEFGGDVDRLADPKAPEQMDQLFARRAWLRAHDRFPARVGAQPSRELVYPLETSRPSSQVVATAPRISTEEARGQYRPPPLGGVSAACRHGSPATTSVSYPPAADAR
jgi:hypothetical protein